MRGERNYFAITLLISILVGIISPLVMAGKPIDRDNFFYLTALSFTGVWVIYVVVLWTNTFLGKGRLRIKVIRDKNPTIVRYDLPKSKQKE